MPISGRNAKIADQVQARRTQWLHRLDDGLRNTDKKPVQDAGEFLRERGNELFALYEKGNLKGSLDEIRAKDPAAADRLEHFLALGNRGSGSPLLQQTTPMQRVAAYTMWQHLQNSSRFEVSGDRGSIEAVPPNGKIDVQHEFTVQGDGRLRVDSRFTVTGDAVFSPNRLGPRSPVDMPTPSVWTTTAFIEPDGFTTANAPSRVSSQS